jgi:hypothetical protein
MAALKDSFSVCWIELLIKAEAALNPGGSKHGLKRHLYLGQELKFDRGRRKQMRNCKQDAKKCEILNPPKSVT